MIRDNLKKIGGRTGSFFSKNSVLIIRIAPYRGRLLLFISSRAKLATLTLLFSALSYPSKDFLNDVQLLTSGDHSFLMLLARLFHFITAR